jgi:hypothetical protein
MENRLALGLVTMSLGRNEEPAEMGYLTVLSVEAIYECLAQNRILPDVQAEPWDGYWYTERHFFGKEEGDNRVQILVTDDPKRLRLGIIVVEEVSEEAYRGALKLLRGPKCHIDTVAA